jgi:prepilin-type N-terminal cleavage/methylation domain-containing protein/prepilin-type processing-associated H-X9-DG protein
MSAGMFEQLLTDFFYGSETPAQRENLHAMLATSAACRKSLAEQARLEIDLRTLFSISGTGGLSEKADGDVRQIDFYSRRPLKMWRHLPQAGFTLVELLVVIAVLSILAGLMLPALSKAKEQARQAMCMSNLRQQNLAMIQYTGDYVGWYPAAINDTTQKPWGSWCWMLSPYFGFTWPATSANPTAGPAIYYCPSALKKSYYSWTNIIELLSYGVNRYTYETGLGLDVKVGRWENPGQMLLMGDLEFAHAAIPSVKDGDNYSSVVNCKVAQVNSFVTWNPNAFSYRHNDQANILFMDSHIKRCQDRGDGFPSGIQLYNGGTVY